MRLKLFIITVIMLMVASGLVVSAQSGSDPKTISASLVELQLLPKTIANIKAPDIETPNWLQAILDAEAAAALAAQQAARAASVSTVNYEVTTKGVITADYAEFKSLANQTLNDSRGWSRLGVAFREVASGGSFTLVLSEASQVPTYYPSICSSSWSCQVGRYVIINQDRWLGASSAWNQSGGSLRDYRHMVVNHETGHWLGHRDNNGSCGGSGQPAPIMQQQSINLLGCSFNPWPLNFEIWSSRLGI